MLNFIYYPVSFILWVWHKVFGYVFGEASGVAWALAVVFLVFTLRAILYKPFVHQVRSMRKMQEFQPEIAKIREKYKNDRQKQTEEMQRLQRDHGVNPLGGCLPVLVQVPVFIGLFHVLREFKPGKTENYYFDAAGNASFVDASFFGAKLGAWVTMGEAQLNALGTSIPQMLIVMIPLMIMAGIFTHITARHSVARQTAAQGENPQTAIMNKLMLYVFPIGVVVGAPFLPLAVLIYWVSNNLWTLGQQYVVYKKIDEEEAAKRETAVATQQARAPRPGQKPVRPERVADADADAAGRGSTNSAATTGSAGKDSTGSGPAGKSGSTKTPGAKTPGAKPVTPRKNPPAGGKAPNASQNGSGGSSGGGGSRPPARRGRKRR